MIRIAILGAAKIAPAALVVPASSRDDVTVTAIAARDAARAASFAAEHDIPRVLRSYADIVDDPEIDAVYIALPPSLHHPWAMAAVRRGKNVLCEKPFALSGAEAQEMVDAASDNRVVLCEAFHWRYHPLADRVCELVRELGRLERIDATFTAQIPDTTDIRYQLALGGGATMDLGCYCVSWVRTFSGEQPTVVAAEASRCSDGVDIALTAEISLPSGGAGTIHSAMDEDFRATVTVIGEHGRVVVENPLVPHYGHVVTITDAHGTSRTETVDGPSTYDAQLDAFTRAVTVGTALPTGGADAVDTMRVIDQIYEVAGLGVRGATP